MKKKIVYFLNNNILNFSVLKVEFSSLFFSLEVVFCHNYFLFDIQIKEHLCSGAFNIFHLSLKYIMQGFRVSTIHRCKYVCMYFSYVSNNFRSLVNND